MNAIIYKIVPRDLWQEAEKAGEFSGSPVDHADGYIHFSTAEQVVETAAKHFAGKEDLLLVAVDVERIGRALKYEASRGGNLFPHLYAPLTLAAVRWVKPLRLDTNGNHLFPALES